MSLLDEMRVYARHEDRCAFTVALIAATSMEEMQAAEGTCSCGFDKVVARYDRLRILRENEQEGAA